MDKKVYIYILSDSFRSNIRYVGKTNSLKRRLSDHKKEINYKNKKSSKHKWFREVYSKGGDIFINVLEEVRESNWIKKEIYWISEIGKKYKLTNTSKGGCGSDGSPIKHKEKFEIVRDKVQSLNIRTRKDYYKFVKLNKNLKLPTSPNRAYKNRGWTNFPDFLRGNKKLIYYYDFRTSKHFVRKVKIKCVKQWENFCKSGKKPRELPSAPNKFYKKEWISWSEFFGKKEMSFKKRNIKSFKKLKNIVKKLNIKTRKEWREYCSSGKKPNTIPSHPELCYKKEWKGWNHFFS